MLKSAVIDCFGNGLHTVKVLYWIDEVQCIFSATTSASSSISFAEGIVKKICEVEQRELRTLRFFDLQTHRGYRSKKLGEFDFDELRFEMGSEGGLFVAGWNSVPLPPVHQKLFAHLIGRAE